MACGRACGQAQRVGLGEPVAEGMEQWDSKAQTATQTLRRHGGVWGTLAYEPFSAEYGSSGKCCGRRAVTWSWLVIPTLPQPSQPAWNVARDRDDQPAPGQQHNLFHPETNPSATNRRRSATKPIGREYTIINCVFLCGQPLALRLVPTQTRSVARTT